MKGNQRVILHIIFDGVLFDQVYPRFEKMEKYDNRYLLDNLGNEHRFKFIRNSEKIICAKTLEEWSHVIKDPSVDIIYMHGLWQSYLKIIDYIRPNVVVMWWVYGMEIYENCLRWPPLLPLRLYKPRTHWFCLKNIMSIHLLTADLSVYFPKIYVSLIKIYYFIKGKKGDELKRLLSRIDFAFTPLEIELEELKKRHPYIKAKPYRLRPSFVKEPIQIHKSVGGILLEHSANLTNNHLDIIAAIKKKELNLKNRDIYIPLSYGEKKLADRVQIEANFEDANVHCLMEAIPFSEYSEMISSCTHAIFGMLRQSGLGNIYLCLRRGVKVFFFEDSILYKYFKNKDFYVFTIEHDLNDSSITEPLTIEQAQNNYDRFYSMFGASYGTYQQQFDEILKGIFE